MIEQIRDYKIIKKNGEGGPVPAYRTGRRRSTYCKSGDTR